MGHWLQCDARPGALARMATLLCAILWVGGCTPTRLFHADFEADTIGHQPNASPPTAPAGDYITYVPVPGGVEQLEISSLMGKSVMVRSTPAANPVAFVGIEKSYGNNPVYAIYNGASLGVAAAGPGVSIALASGHHVSAVAITFKNGKVYKGFPSDASAANLLGDIPYAEPHVVVISINPAAKTYNLSILQSAAADILRTNQPIANDAFFDSERLMLAVHPEAGGEAGNPMYVMDDVLITQKEPSTVALEADAVGKPRTLPARQADGP